ncbi:hypothetical protein C7974DRAFT_377071 [Boeremia exigua]|uniref:uncharacterized protein n=1 Tax=Boeremia exigua TaxID=749465 RepID=UPI001E8DB1E5|nr:uncharacterized protein C7974DRAFT_377071 [Boeremia exigua]KAH6625573.1 hypothetical protein C7974DRAFT_377071 [Boeremia exigua]
MLWRAECDDSAPNLAGLTLLYVAMANNGNGGQVAARYIAGAGRMAKRMRLFGIADRVTALESRLQREEAQYAFRQATWGPFNAYKGSSLFERFSTNVLYGMKVQRAAGKIQIQVPL